MSLLALLYAYFLGGITFIPLVVVGIVLYTACTSVPVHAAEPSKRRLGAEEIDEKKLLETNDAPRTRKGWLTVRRTFEELPSDSSYVNFMRTFLDSRTKDPKKSRPKDMWYVVLKAKVLYLYEDEEMTECEAAIELSGYDVIVYPEGLLDGELFARRNSICLRPKSASSDKPLTGTPKDVKLEKEDPETKTEQGGASLKKREKARDKSLDLEKKRDGETVGAAASWFMFVRSNFDMEEWYLALVHASEHPAQTPTLEPLEAVFEPADMEYLVATLDEQPDVIPMRWFNALIGRIFFSYYRTHILEAFIIKKLMKKLSKVKRPTFLSDIVVTEVSVGDKAPTFSKPMLKELTKEGDASMEVHARYKGEVRITVEATATINLGVRLKTYVVKLVLAAILREIEGNMLIKVKRPPSNRIWYAFTQMPRIVLDVEPVVSDRQITWSMILGTIESRLKEIIQESVVLPNMDDISFFESLPYAHRGGIWADACRMKRTTLSTLQPIIPSAPNPDLQGTSSTSSQNDAIPTEGVAAIEPPDDQSPTPTETRSSKEGSVMELSATGTTPNGTRRRSWFSGPVADDAPVLVDQPLDSSDDQIANEDARGRTTHPKAMSTGSRSSSSKGGMTDVNSGDLGQDTEDSAQSQLFPSPSRRSSSRQSQRDVHASNESEDSTKSISGRSTPIPRRTSDAASTMSSSPPASSLLSTLRTRDRQALKESAKEMARKIRVNWGFGKDWNMITASREPATDNSRATQDGSSSVMHANYADVRAAVAERKEKEKTASRDATEMTVPGTARSEVPEDTSANKDAIVSSSLSLPSSPPENTLRRSLSRGRTTTEIDDVPVESPHTPILVQPQGKTMTIPGIHASHRGEVMALGYVAPPMTVTDKNKNHSFYRRLLKSESSQDPLDSVSGVSGADEDIGSLTLGSTTAGATYQARPMPPPLPPRSSIPNPAINPSMGTPFLASKGGDSFPQGERSELLSSESSKEEHKDLSVPEARVSPVITSLSSTAPTPPPLPPRRIQTSA
ncbi:hypothetical protein F5887DRAFT_1073107 [Amanita rubescens]|nr:hypothetical protein F5887DRAFT_1073107 [Amanita rubescens]